MASALAGVLIIILTGVALLGRKKNGGATAPPVIERKDTLIQLRAGSIVGSRLDVGATSVIQYFGIPYAQTTEGDARFASPRPMENFPGGHFEATNHGDRCAQLLSNGSIVGSEDCLHVSVWAPFTTANASRRTVVVVATGEWYQTGSNSDHDWSQLAATGDFVVVAPNHRVGVMGFLNSNWSTASGSAGVEDLLLALKWAKDNAAFFHGNPQDMVALGQGSGAGMLSLATLVLPEGFFRRAILQGLSPGTPLPMNTKKSSKAYIEKMTKSLGCGQPDIDCLRKASKQALLNASSANPLRFVPSVDSKAFSGLKSFRQLPKKSPFGSMDIIIGCNLAEGGTLYTQYLLPHAEKRNASDNATLLFLSFLNFMAGGEFDYIFSFDPNLAPAIEAIGVSHLKDHLSDIALICTARMFAKHIKDANGTAYFYVATSNQVLKEGLVLEAINYFFKNA